MKPEDAPLLSAYLDDELDADARLEVEAAIAAEPGLARDLASLVLVRDLVAGLDRPGPPCGVASSVLAMAKADESTRARRPFYRLATAAGLASALFLWHRSGRLDPAVGPPATDPIVALNVAPKSAPPGRVDRVEVTPPPPPIEPASSPDEVERRRIAQLLDRPGLRRVVVDGERGGPIARDRVDALLRRTVRKNPDFGRLGIARGLVIDPAHTGPAEVFVAEMDGPERDDFLRRLAEEFPGVVDEAVPDPGLGTRLAEVGRASLGAGQRGAGLAEPPADRAEVALRHPGPPPSTIEERRFDLIEGHTPPLALGPVPGAVPDGVTTGHAPQRRPAATAGSRATAPVPVLIWVGPGRSGD